MRPSVKFAITLLSLAVVAALFLLDISRTSPGELSPVHGRIAELAGSEGCDACHGGFGESLEDACLECHQDVARSLTEGRGLHGTANARACARCHVEHHGAELELSGAQAFAKAGVVDRARYDHAALGFTLEGAHAELACARCHPKADAVLLERGDKRFLGLKQDCASCHDDPHQGRMRLACADCHGQSRPFREVATFQHGEGFRSAEALSRGAHAKAACADCHVPGSERSVEALGQGGLPPTVRGCSDCHASPHAADFLPAAAKAMGVVPAVACTTCHDPERGPFRAARAPERVEWHAATGFALASPHADVACAKCHAQYGDAAAAGDFRARYPGRRADDCASCHADPHAGQFRAAGACLDCHERERFRPAKFSVAEHAGTRFALDGAHAAAACGDCHEPDPTLAGRAVRFAGTPTACSDCHVDAHDGRFALSAVRAALPDLARGCAACHDTHSFSLSPEARARFDHGRAAGFVLDGEHTRVACETCHAPKREPDGAGRRFGRAAEQFGASGAKLAECSTCHADVHEGSFASVAGKPAPNAAFASGAALGDARGGTCAACHTTAGFRGSPAREFDHGAWTGFALEGAHRRGECAACHAPLARPAAKGARTFARAKASFPGPIDRCDGCHADPHGGRFDRPGTPDALRGATSCARCHDQESFQGASSSGFDHEGWTGFRLDGAHAKTACVACHTPDPGELAAGRAALGRAPGAGCVDCHADPHAGQFASGAGGADTSCNRCHDASRTFAEIAFDHQRDARFALDATHQKVACAACHVSVEVPGGARVVRYRGLGTACADCHGFKKVR